MPILLLAEHDSSGLSAQTARALTAALQIDAVVDVVVAGNGIAAIGAEAAALAGVRQVLVVDHDALAQGLAEPLTDLLVGLVDAYSGLVAPATSAAKNVLPRVAAKLDVMQVSDVIAVLAPDTFKRPIYAGNAIETVQSAEAKKVLTVRASAFEPAASTGAAPTVAVAFAGGAYASRFLRDETSTSDRPALEGARIVVAGGRAFGSKEQFEAHILLLADKLGAAVGASRAAVDAGYAPNDWQVGQTGKIVAPEVYIAVGISGAIQHLAGMTSSKVIIAINNDADAPIFRVADYGLVGDLFEILPALNRAL